MYGLPTDRHAFPIATLTTIARTFLFTTLIEHLTNNYYYYFCLLIRYSDQTKEENSVLFGRRNNGALPTVDVKTHQPTKDLKEMGSVVDWTAAGRVTPVKNQGQCGSCWAHSVVEQIESQFIADGNSMWEFSVQQVNSCVKKCFGCGGGDTPAGYEYLMNLPSNEGLGSAAWAPYIQSMTDECTGPKCTESCKDLDIDVLKTKASLTGYYAQVTGYTYATDACTSGSCGSQNLTLLANNIAEYGPASICVNAASWTSYTGGVLTQAACGGYAYNDLDHCVQLTGYNADEGYWIVRNSWSTDWGNDGYIYLQFDENTCGLANEATFVQLASTDSQKTK